MPFRDGDFIGTAAPARPVSVMFASGLLAGHPKKEIAAELSLSPYMIQNRLKRVFAKAAGGSRRELVAQLNPATQAVQHESTDPPRPHPSNNEEPQSFA